MAHSDNGKKSRFFTGRREALTDAMDKKIGDLSERFKDLKKQYLSAYPAQAQEQASEKSLTKARKKAFWRFRLQSALFVFSLYFSIGLLAGTFMAPWGVVGGVVIGAVSGLVHGVISLFRPEYMLINLSVLANTFGALTFLGSLLLDAINVASSYSLMAVMDAIDARIAHDGARWPKLIASGFLTTLAATLFSVVNLFTGFQLGTWLNKKVGSFADTDASTGLNTRQASSRDHTYQKVNQQLTPGCKCTFELDDPEKSFKAGDFINTLLTIGDTEIVTLKLTKVNKKPSSTHSDFFPCVATVVDKGSLPEGANVPMVGISNLQKK